MVDKENKGLLLGIAAATALIGAALLYHYVSGDDDEAEGPATGIMAELEEANLGAVKRHEQSGQLDPIYTCKMLNFVTLTARKRRHDERTEAISERRECYSKEDWTRYRQIVKEQFMAEDQMCQVVLREAMECLSGITEAEFQKTMQAMA